MLRYLLFCCLQQDVVVLALIATTERSCLRVNESAEKAKAGCAVRGGDSGGNGTGNGKENGKQEGKSAFLG